MSTLRLQSLKERRSKKNVFTNGFHELSVVFRQLKQLRTLRRFLLSFFLYSMGVQTVMLIAAGFSKKEIFPNPEDEPKLLFTLIQTLTLASILLISSTASTPKPPSASNACSKATGSGAAPQQQPVRKG